jgi:hypothetical protein
MAVSLIWEGSVASTGNDTVLYMDRGQIKHGFVAKKKNFDRDIL